MKSYILYIHHSADMYGADKMLLSLVRGMADSEFIPIVALPKYGPLYDALHSGGIETIILPLAKISRSIFTVKGLLLFPYQVWVAVKALSASLAGKHVALVHSNTLAVLSGAVWAKINRVKHVWHVHEIIERPAVVRKLFPRLLASMSDSVAVISRAVAHHLVAEKPSLEKKISVIWNGVSEPPIVKAEEIAEFRSKVGASCDDVIFALVGRLNRWKGQTLFIEAAELLLKRGHNHAFFVMVGSPPQDQEYWKFDLELRICGSPAKDKIILLDYIDRVEVVWKACDVGVVPSIEPEPFGIVALEAMLAERPVIASNHGGLCEIIDDKVSGLLFKPGSVSDLADAMDAMIRDKKCREAYGLVGSVRARKYFSVDAYISGFKNLYRDILSEC